jgi:hypothetical protein
LPNPFDTNGIIFWIVVWGVGLLILEVVILKPYIKKSKITPKKIQSVLIIVVLAVVTMFSLTSSIILYVLDSSTDNCIAGEIWKISSNKTIDPDDVFSCVNDYANNKFLFVGLSAGMTVIMLFMQFLELAKNRDN